MKKMCKKIPTANLYVKIFKSHGFDRALNMNRDLSIILVSICPSKPSYVLTIIVFLTLQFANNEPMKAVV